MGMHSDDEQGLTEAEYAEMEDLHAQLRDAYRKDPEKTKQAVKDAIDFPRKSGKLN